VRAKPLNSRIAIGILRNGHPVEVGLMSEQLPDNDGALMPTHPRVQPMTP
jgi:hypothetical protein